MSYWIFQANPNEFHFLDALAAEAIHSWHVKQHARQIRAGDTAFLWKAGRDAGIYARARLTADPAPQPPSDDQLRHYAPEWHASLHEPAHLRATLDIEAILPAPLLRDELRLHPLLHDLSILRMPRGTNFAVTDLQGALLAGLVVERCSRPVDPIERPTIR